MYIFKLGLNERLRHESWEGHDTMTGSIKKDLTPYGIFSKKNIIKIGLYKKINPKIQLFFTSFIFILNSSFKNTNSM